ncbi:MAG: methyltransferase domain-containing protein [Deltaproteobacteria bacterium]|nr:methyltransferase domain-containing protein [Deltaproteobacteria bacterium]
MGLTRGGAWLTRWLALPLTAACDVDDPQTTVLRRQIIRDKRFLREIYEEWYRAIAEALPPGDEPVLELGSGAGFMRECVPGLIASDILWVPDVNLVADAVRLPFTSDALRSIVMTNVLHHIPNVRRFLAEAARCVKPGGALVMIEPWVTSWSKFVYGRLHAEPFEASAPDWNLPAVGPLSGANGALPWILFERDRQRFEAEFPTWRISSVEPQMPFRYLVSGGVSLRCLVPDSSHGVLRLLEKSLSPWMSALGMFARIVVTRTNKPSAI